MKEVEFDISIADEEELHCIFVSNFYDEDDAMFTYKDIIMQYIFVLYQSVSGSVVFFTALHNRYA